MIEMDAETYQILAHGFATYGGNAMYPALGLAEEAGEVCGKVAKFIRKNAGTPPPTDLEIAEAGGTRATADKDFRDALEKELGDVCWMVAELATLYGLSLSGIMFGNIQKLRDRQKRGVIVGEGDNR